MTTTSLTSREFKQDPRRARKATAHGPVFITERGRPAYVLLSIDDYRRLGDRPRTLLGSLAMPGLLQIEVDFSPARGIARPAEFG